MLGIVGIVVDGGHRGELVEALNEHALGIHIGKSERALDFVHATLLAPSLHRVDKSTAHFEIVDEVNPSEAYALLIPRFVGATVDDGRHAPDDFPVLVIGQEIVGFAKFEGGIFSGEKVLSISS